MKTWIIHCDLNKFYASIICARYPWLANEPIIVMSNNDGNNICFRPGNLKEKTGIVMGTPIFEIRPLIKRYNIHLYSCNFPLIADISRRVKGILNRFMDEVEDYSIDEVFGKISGLHLQKVQEICREMRRVIWKGLHLPISIGISTSKTLSKVATRFAKKYAGYEGVCSIDTTEQREKALKLTSLSDIWGIGRQYEKKLSIHNIKTAYDFLTKLPAGWIRREMTVVGARTFQELQGISCLELELTAPKKKNMIVSRGYGKMISDVEYLIEATINYLCMGTEKLRKQGSCCGSITVFLETNVFREDLEQDRPFIRIPLQVASNSDFELAPYVRMSIKAAYKKGLLYKKSGVFFNDLCDEDAVQGNLWDSRDRKKERRAMDVKDRINNRYGRHTIKLGAQGDGKEWKIKQEKLPPYWTTRSGDFPEVIDYPTILDKGIELWAVSEGEAFRTKKIKCEERKENKFCLN